MDGDYVSFEFRESLEHEVQDEKFGVYIYEDLGY